MVAFLKQQKYEFSLSIYAILQIILLVCLRKFFNITQYQTALFYCGICGLGMIVFLLCKFTFWNTLKNLYLLVWSTFHGVIVLGLLTNGGIFLFLFEHDLFQITNYFLCFAIFWFFYLIFRKLTLAVSVGNLFIGFISILNHYLVRFRGFPFQISDIKSASTAVHVMQNYDYTPDAFTIFAVLDLIIWSYLIYKMDLKKFSFKINATVSAAVIVGCSWLAFGPYPELYAETFRFRTDNYFADLFAEIRNSSIKLPENYSADYVSDLYNEISNQHLELDSDSNIIKPHIIVIMNEAFSDLRVLGDISTTAPFLENWDAINDNCIKGWTNVSVLGGATANSEYEFLTSDAVALYQKDSIPYNDYFSSVENYPSIVSILSQQGYETIAFHPYLSSCWNRSQVYKAMGFDQMIFTNNLSEQLDTLRTWISDREDYRFIKEWFKNKTTDKPQFFFNVTIQNHSAYNYNGSDFETTVQLTGEHKGKFPQTEQYLSLIKESDAAFQDLLSFFETYEEPVIILMYGDHQPALEPEFYFHVTGQSTNKWGLEQTANQYKTPFIIWHNYDTNYIEIGDLSPNYFASLLLQDAGLSMSSYQQYLADIMQQFPVVNKIALKDSSGTLHQKGSDFYKSSTLPLQMLIYNHTADHDGQIKELFTLNIP